MREEVLAIGALDQLVGIVTLPEHAERVGDLPFLILLNSGILHRVGPNRLYVKIARALARQGFGVLRFDLSGIGDSNLRDDSRSLQLRWTAEVREAMDAVQKTYAAESFGLMGICLGATLSFKTACEDPRVAGAVLINPQDHLHDDLDTENQREIFERAKARHNWRIAFTSSMSGQKWRKALRGEVDYRSVAKILLGQVKRWFQSTGGGSEELREIEANFSALRDRGTDVLHVFSEGDVGIDYLHTMLGRQLKRHQASGAIQVEIIPGSNHTFTLIDNQDDLITSISNWADGLPASNWPSGLPTHPGLEK